MRPASTSLTHLSDAAKKGVALVARNDGRPDPDRRSDEKPRERQERDEKNNEGRGAESVHDRGQRPMQVRRPDQAARRRKNKEHRKRNAERHRDGDRCADHGERIEEGGPEPLNHLWGHNRVSLPDPRRARIAPRPAESRRTDRQQPAVTWPSMRSNELCNSRKGPPNALAMAKGQAQDRSCPVGQLDHG